MDPRMPQGPGALLGPQGPRVGGPHRLRMPNEGGMGSSLRMPMGPATSSGVSMGPGPPRPPNITMGQQPLGPASGALRAPITTTSSGQQPLGNPIMGPKGASTMGPGLPGVPPEVRRNSGVLSNTLSGGPAGMSMMGHLGEATMEKSLGSLQLAAAEAKLKMNPDTVATTGQAVVVHPSTGATVSAAAQSVAVTTSQQSTTAQNAQSKRCRFATSSESSGPKEVRE